MAAAAATIGGLALSAIQGEKASDAAQKQADLQRQQMAKADDLARAQFEEDRRRYEEEKAYYAPFRKWMSQYAMSDQPLGLDKKYGAIEQQYGDVSREMLDQYRPGSGFAASQMTGLDIAKAGARSSAYGQAVDAKNALRAQLAAGGTNLKTPNNTAMQQSAYQMANYYGNQANQYGQAASSAYGQMGQGVDSLAWYLGTMNTRRKGTTEVSQQEIDNVVDSLNKWQWDHNKPFSSDYSINTPMNIPTFNPYGYWR